MRKAAVAPGWKQGVLWAFANAAGWSGAMGILWLGDRTYSQVNPWLIPCGLVIGLAQWMVLAQHFSRSMWWIPAYGLGWYLGLVAGFHSLFVPNWLTMGAAGGLCIGAVQWLMLRRLVHHSLVWIPSCIVSALAGCFAGVFTGVHAYASGISIGVSYLIGGTVAGAVIGILSGFALVLLLKNQRFQKAVPGIESAA